MRKHSIFVGFLIIGLELLVGTMAIIVCLSFLLAVSRNFLESFDRSLIMWVYTFRTDWLTELMKFITFLGGEIFVVSGIILLLALLFRKHKISSFNFAVLLVFGTIINLLLKFIFQRQRPDYLPLIFESTYSFPSGHSMNSFIFYSCIAYFIIRNNKSTRVRFLTVAVLGILVCMIGISRVYLGAHYPSDVIAGFIGGALWFVLIVLVEKTAKKYKLFTKVL